MSHAPVRGALAALLLLLACQSPEAQGKPPPERPATTDITSKDYVMPPLPRAWVRLKDVYGGVQRVEVEVAATPASRQRGMMWRTELAPGKGMLFLFPEEEVQSFWMANTLISLDMIFITSGMQVAGIVERAVPQSRTPRSVGVPSQYVLEVPGGWSQSVGIVKNSPVEFEDTASIQIVP